MLLAMPTVWAVGMFTQIVAMAMLPSKQMVNCPEVNKKGSDPHGLRVVPDEPRCGPSRDGLGDKKCTTKANPESNSHIQERVSVLTLYQLRVDGRVNVAATDYAANQPIPKEIWVRHHGRHAERPGRFDL